MKLSIITINCNNLSGLKKTAESVISQTSKDYEWIVIDGGSTDGSKEYLESISDHITYWVSEPDKGIYNAMNKGVDAAHGDYLIFMNSGDAFYDDSVIKDFADASLDGDVIYGREIGIDEKGDLDFVFNLPDNPLRLSFFFESTLRHQATFFSSRCFENHRYNEHHKINSDLELFLCLYYEKFRFVPYDRFISIYDISGISLDPQNLRLRNQEFDESVSKVLPQGMIADYHELINLKKTERHRRQVDIYVCADEIVNSGKLIRYISRLVLYPIHLLIKLTSLLPNKN